MNGNIIMVMMRERQKRMNRWKWVGMYFMVFVVWFTLLLLWGKGVIG